jgi:hypothetical protein
VFEPASAVTFDGLELTGNTDGLFLHDQVTVIGTNGEIASNDRYGVYVQGVAIHADPTVSISQSSIYGNFGGYDVYLDGGFSTPESTSLRFRENWWGTAVEEEIDAHIYDRVDDVANASVDWCRHLESPTGPAAAVSCFDLSICGEIEILDDTTTPYLATASIHVCPTGTLQIEAGVELRFADTGAPLSFDVEGTLDVNGTEPSPVLITSDAEPPAVMDWDGIDFYNGASGSIEHAVIEYGNYGLEVHDDAQVTLTGVTSRYNQEGLHLLGDGDLTHVAADGCSFTDNNSYGVYLAQHWLYDPPSVWINNSSIHSNLGPYDLYTYYFQTPLRTVLNAKRNWWGSADPNVFGPRIYDQRVWHNAPIVDWCGYLDGPGGSPTVDAHCPDLSICSETVLLDQTDKPYQVTSFMHVCDDGTLQIGPGVDLVVAAGSPQSGIRANGNLTADGIAENRVTIASDSPTPQAEDWHALQVREGGTLDLHYTDISHATYGLYLVDGAVASLDHVRARYNRDGLTTAGPTPATATAHSCSFTDNADAGVHLVGYWGAGNPDLSIQWSSIHSNGGNYDYRVSQWNQSSNTVLNAQENWWGSSDSAVFSARIGDRRQNDFNAFIDWCRYLDGPDGDPVLDAHCPDLAVCGETVVLDLTDKPYQVTCDLEICDSGTLQIGAGVDLMFAAADSPAELRVLGSLDIGGTEQDPVTLASSASAPATWDWEGIEIGPTGTADLVHTEIHHAFSAVHVFEGGNATLDNVIARLNKHALYVDRNGGGTVYADRCTFTDNEINAVRLQGYLSAPNPVVEITRSSIHSSGSSHDYHTSGFNNARETSLLARDNWWGTTDPMVIGPRIRDIRTASDSPIVDWCGWLDGEGGQPVHDVHCPDLAVCASPVTLDLTDKPFQITSDLHVCAGQTLQAGAGVELQTVVTTPRPDFEVRGTLDVDGTYDAPVRFGSASATPVVGDWGGLRLLDNAVADLSWAEITHGDYGIAVYDDADATLIGVAARENVTGLFVQDNFAPPAQVRAAGCSFTHNDEYGVHYSGYDPFVSITGSALHSNQGVYDLYSTGAYNMSHVRVWANDNWWGTNDQSEIRDRIRDYDDNSFLPRVYSHPFGDDCVRAVGVDGDGDGLGDIEDNCPITVNVSQADTDGDRIGDACDPQPGTMPSGACDGIGDGADGYPDADGDGWGDPCDFQPTRADAYPGAPELCDGRDNDGDTLFGLNELTDADLDRNIACGDCDDDEPAVYACACELCNDGQDNDCDLATDGSDPDCVLNPTCIVMVAGPDPLLTMARGDCGGATLAGPFDVIRGALDNLTVAGSSIDLGSVDCVEGGLDWDRVTDWAADPNPACEALAAHYYLSRNTGDPDFGSDSGGRARDIMDPDPACP